MSRPQRRGHGPLILQQALETIFPLPDAPLPGQVAGMLQAFIAAFEAIGFDYSPPVTKEKT